MCKWYDPKFISQYNRDYRIKNKAKTALRLRLYYLNNKERLLKKQKDKSGELAVYNKDYWQKNKEKLALKSKVYRLKNEEHIRSVKNIYNKTHRSQNSDYVANRLKTNTNYRLAHGIRHRMRAAIKNGQKVGSAVRDLGCSISELKVYLESKFLPKMNWSNWGQLGWHLDHIIPLSSFDLTDRKQFLEACHYTNLQPLWAKDNRIKSNSLK